MKKWLRVLSVLLAVMMVFSAMPLMTFAAEGEIATWDGTIVTPSGTGTAADPYKISNGSELIWVVSLSEEDSNDKYFVITEDIYLNSPSVVTYDENGYVNDFNQRAWPAGYASSWSFDRFGVFSGYIDGQGHTIFGMSNAWANAGNWGLFATVAGGATIKNINMDSVYYKRANSSWGWSNTWASGLVGQLTGGSVTIENCTVYRSRLHEQSEGYANIGGILGRNPGYGAVEIKGCGVDAITSTRSDYMNGGIVGDGWSYPVQVSDSWSNIYPAGSGNTNNNGGASYTNCYTLNADADPLADACPAGLEIVSGSVKGDAAKTTMPNIGWSHKWTTTDAYPMPLAVETACDGEWVVDAKATSAAAGSMSKTCSICGKTETKEIAQIPDLSNYNGEYTLDVNTTGDVVVGGETVVIVPTGSEVVIIAAADHIMTSEEIEGGVKYTVTVDDSNKYFQNTDTGVKYTNFADAMSEAVAGQTIVLMQDYDNTAGTSRVPADVVLDLNGHYITATDFLSFGDVIDTADTLGGIIVSNNTEEAFTMLQPDNAQLPLYDVENGCYRFFAYEVQALMKKATETTPLQFGFKILFENKDAYALLATAPEAVTLKIQIDVVGHGATDLSIPYECSADILAEYAAVAADSSSKLIYLTVYGTEDLDAGATVSATPTLTSVTTVAKTGNTKTYTK